MKTKNEILTALGGTSEERLLVAGLLDKEQICRTRGYLTHTKFLSMGERARCMEAVRLAGATGHALFWGGYAEAERGIFLFFPDWSGGNSLHQQSGGNIFYNLQSVVCRELFVLPSASLNLIRSRGCRPLQRFLWYQTVLYVLSGGLDIRIHETQLY